MHTLPCVCPPRVESLFPPVLSKSCNQIPLAFKVWFSRNSSSHCRTPRLGNLTWGSEPSLYWVNFCGISVLQFVSHPSSKYGIWFYCDCAPTTISFWLLLCLWLWDIFFGEFQCLSVNGCSAVSCDSGALARGSECTSFYSAILNQSHQMGIECWPYKAIWPPDPLSNFFHPALCSRRIAAFCPSLSLPRGDPIRKLEGGKRMSLGCLFPWHLLHVGCDLS